MRPARNKLDFWHDTGKFANKDTLTFELEDLWFTKCCKIQQLAHLGSTTYRYEGSEKRRMLRGTCYYNKEIKVENDAKSAKMVTNVQTFRDCALHQWNVR